MPGIDELTLAIGLLLAAIMLLAGLVHGALGLGFPMVATPLLALLTDVRSAILITLLPTVAVNVASILKGGGWGHSIGRHWPIALYVVVGSVVGTRLLIVTDPAPFKLLLAAMIGLYLALGRLREVPLGWIARQRQAAYLLFGLVAGFMAGTVNVMVPILIICFLEIGLAPLAMVQVFNLCFLAGKGAQIATFGAAGTLGVDALAATLPLALAALAALWLGMRIRERTDTASYRRWVRRALAAIALLLVGQYLWQ